MTEMDCPRRVGDVVATSPGVSAAEIAAGVSRAADAVTPATFGEIYRARFEHVHRWVSYLGGAPAEAEDLTQKVFLVVLRKLPHFDGQNLDGFLFGITRRIVKGHRRLAWFRRWLQGDDATEIDMFASAEEGVEGALGRKREVEWVLSRMSEKLRTALILSEVEEYTAEDIAQLLSIPTNTVSSRLRLARKRFLELVALLDAEDTR